MIGPRKGWPVRRRDAARHLLHPRQLRDSMTLARQPHWRNASLAGLQAALVAAIALPLVHLSPWPHLIGYAALGSLVALFGRFAPAGRRRRILFYSALCQVMAVFVMSTAGWLGVGLIARFALLALACGVFYFLAVRGRFGPPGPLIFIFAAGAAMPVAATFQEVLQRSAATALVALLAWGVCSASERLRRPSADGAALPADPVRPLPEVFEAAARGAVAAAVALFTAHALGADYPVWAAMGALAVLQGAHLHVNMNRALQRMAGTVAGALLVWLILEQDPSVWAIIAILAALQYFTELIIGGNYALGQILVTPMALLMTYLASSERAGTSMVPERILDTVLGAVIGMVIAVLWSSLEQRRHLARHVAGRRSGA